MSIQMITASKYHGDGNDFIVVAPAQVPEDDYSALAQAICDYHFGVGADGCVFVGEISTQHVSLRIFNRDGSEAGMSGNGFRCGCAFLHHRSLVDLAGGEQPKQQVAIAEAYFFNTLEQAEIEILGLFALTAAAATGGHRDHYRHYDDDGGHCSQTVLHEVLLLLFRALASPT